ncbi:hypothetical protein V7128_02050 [Neobacillus vireti]|uniref:hypothetical protein n=1 Tax=Neobacillus vireti TaxID=220686 RepID=UPI00300094DA
MEFKAFNVFFDQKVNGNLVEKCFRITARTKSEAVSIYQKEKPTNSIFRCVKVGF